MLGTSINWIQLALSETPTTAKLHHRRVLSLEVLNRSHTFF